MLLAVIVPVETKSTTVNDPVIVRLPTESTPEKFALLPVNWLVIVAFVDSIEVVVICSKRNSFKVRFNEPLPVIDFDISFIYNYKIYKFIVYK